MDALDEMGSAPLSMAAGRNHCGVVAYLLRLGANPNLRDSVGNTALFAAVLTNSQLCVHALANVSDLNVRDGNGRSIFHVAAGRESLESLEFLSPRFEDVDTRSVQCVRPATGELVPFYNETALMMACQFGRHAAVSFLLERRASRQARDSLGRTPLHYASLHGSVACVRRLLGRTNRLRMRAEDINAVSNNGWTALHFAAHHGEIQCCGLLVEAGASLTAVSSSGNTPLMFARQRHPINAALHSLLAGRVAPSQSGTACDHCGISAREAPNGLEVCASCQRKLYCGLRCQRLGWPAHKEECKCWTAEAEKAKAPILWNRQSVGSLGEAS